MVPIWEKCSIEAFYRYSNSISHFLEYSHFFYYQPSITQESVAYMNSFFEPTHLPCRKVGLYLVGNTLSSNYTSYRYKRFNSSFSMREEKLYQLQWLKTRAKKLILDVKYKVGWSSKWPHVKSLLSFDQGVMTYISLHSLCPKIFAINSLKDPWFLGIEPEIIEICKFP